MELETLAEQAAAFGCKMKWRDPQLLGITPFRGETLAVLVLERSLPVVGTVSVARHRLGLEVSTDSDERRTSGMLERPSTGLGNRAGARARRLLKRPPGQITLSLQRELNHRGGIEKIHWNLSLGPDVDDRRPCPFVSSSAISRSIRDSRFDVYRIAPSPIAPRPASGQYPQAERAGQEPVRQYR